MPRERDYRARHAQGFQAYGPDPRRSKTSCLPRWARTVEQGSRNWSEVGRRFAPSGTQVKTAIGAGDDSHRKKLSAFSSERSASATISTVELSAEAES